MELPGILLVEVGELVEDAVYFVAVSVPAVWVGVSFNVKLDKGDAQNKL